MTRSRPPAGWRTGTERTCAPPVPLRAQRSVTASLAPRATKETAKVRRTRWTTRGRSSSRAASTTTFLPGPTSRLLQDVEGAPVVVAGRHRRVPAHRKSHREAGGAGRELPGDPPGRAWVGRCAMGSGASRPWRRARTASRRRTGPSQQHRAGQEPATSGGAVVPGAGGRQQVRGFRVVHVFGLLSRDCRPRPVVSGWPGSRRLGCGRSRGRPRCRRGQRLGVVVQCCP